MPDLYKSQNDVHFIKSPLNQGSDSLGNLTLAPHSGGGLTVAGVLASAAGGVSGIATGLTTLLILVEASYTLSLYSSDC